jgi:hypothetical protein
MEFITSSALKDTGFQTGKADMAYSNETRIL